MDPNFHVTSATFNHKFTKFSQINNLIPSPACWIQNMPWKIFIEPVLRENKKYLSVFVGCAAPITKNPWTCRASVRMYKLDGSKPKIIKTSQFLNFDSSASTSWGHDTFILWDTVLNRSNGFIKDDSIVIEVIIDAEIPEGFKLTSNYFTDERATAAVQLCDKTISNLQSKIQELTSQNELLQTTNKTSAEQIENLKNLLKVAEKNSTDFETKFTEENDSNIELQKSIDELKKQLEKEKVNTGNLTKTLNENKSKIQELTDQNEQLQNTNKTSTEQIENLENLLKVSEEKSTDFETKFNKEHESNIELQKSVDDIKKQLEKEKENTGNITKTLNEKSSKIDALNEQIQDINTIKEELTSCKAQNNEASNKYTSLLDEFDNYKRVITNTGSESENALKTEIDTMRKRNIEVKKKFSSLQNELNSANAKLKQIDELNKKIEELNKDKTEMQKINDAISEELSKAETIIDIIKKEAEEEEENKKKEIDDYTTKIQSLKSKLYESLVKLQISQDMTEEIQIIQDEKNKLLEQLTVGYEKYNNLKQENTTLNSQIDNLNKQLTDANEKLNSLISEGENKQAEVKNCKDQLTVLNSTVTDLKKNNDDLKVTLEQANSKINISETSHSEDLTKLLNEKTDLENENDSLKSKLETAEKELKENKDQKLDQVSSLTSDKTNLENKLTSVNKELQETKDQLKEAQRDVNKLIICEGNLSSLQSQFDDTKIKVQQLKDKKLDDALSNLNEEKISIQNLLSSLQQELEETKTKLNITKSETPQTKNSNDEKVKLLNQKISHIETLSDQKNKNDNTNNQTHQTENPDSEVDIDKSTGKIDQKIVKTPRPSSQEDLEDLTEFPAKDGLGTLTQEFKKQIKDVDHAMQVERQTLMKKIDDLLYQLVEAKQEIEGSKVIETKLKGELCRLKEETNALRKLKDEFCTQLSTRQNLCTDTFQIMIDILNSLKDSGKLSCTVESLMISYFNNIKNYRQLCPENMSVTKKIESAQVNTEISTRVLQKKLDQLQEYYEESLSLIRKNCALEHNETSRLRTSNNELLVVIETEMNVTRHYKEMLKIANSRLENYRKQFNDLDNRFQDEKNRRYECEEINKRSKAFSEGIECLLNDLKQKLLKHSIKLSGIEPTESVTQNSNDVVKNLSCNQTVMSSLSVGKCTDLPAKITNDSSQNGNNNASVSLSIAQEPQTVPISDISTKKEVKKYSIDNSEIIESPIEIKNSVSKKLASVTPANVT